MVITLHSTPHKQKMYDSHTDTVFFQHDSEIPPNLRILAGKNQNVGFVLLLLYFLRHLSFTNVIYLHDAITNLQLYVQICSLGIHGAIYRSQNIF